ncbi:cytochrome P450 [Haliea sp. E17]|uniref:cytochrome P450 n=1 Tax=Haliea sp. E17 TaxID=3401576 RepID=UPI003AAD50E8
MEKTVPPHVPRELVRDFDMYGYPANEWDVPQNLYRQVRAEGMPEIFWSPYNGGHWVITRASIIEEVIDNSDHFSNRYVGLPKHLNPARIFRPFQQDPPDSVPFRHLLAGLLTKQIVAAGRDAVQELAIELIEGFKPRGQCEFVIDFAQHLPIRMFMAIMSIPEEDRKPLLAIAEKISRPKYPDQRLEGYAEMDDYSLKLIEERRDGPEDDIVAKLCRAEIDGRKLNEEELLGVLGLLLIAGLDTVSGMLGFFVQHLARHPEQRREIRDNPDLIPNAVEELLRRYAHTTLTREVRVDLNLRGVEMREGDMMAVPLVLHNVDEEKFEDPFRVDFTREQLSSNVAFGGKVHRCLGALLARTELRVFLEEWLNRIPEFSIAPGAQPKINSRVTTINQVLPLVWETGT